MITRLIAEITPINCVTLKNIVFPIQIPKHNEHSHKAEITLFKSKDKENLYNSAQIDVYGCELSIKNKPVIKTPDNIYNVMAITILEEFLIILGFCLRYAISTKSENVCTLPMKFEYLPETAEEKRQIVEFSKEEMISSYGGLRIPVDPITKDDIYNYYNWRHPISFFMNAEKAESPILKIREYLRIFEFFNEKYKNDSRFSYKGKKKLSCAIIKKFTDEEISANRINEWWAIDHKCSHGGRGGLPYITCLDIEGLKEVIKINNEIRPIARLLIEKIAQAENRT